MGDATFPSVDATTLTAALAAVDHLWSLPSRFAETGAHHGYQQITVCLAGRVEVPALADLLAPFAPVHDAWLSRLAPGGFIREHIDAGPYYERWQLPFMSGTFGTFIQRAGVPHRVHHYEWHHVTNDGPDHRVSLVIDRAIPLDVPSGPLRFKE